MDLNEKGGSVMFEGAQGVLLDLIYGTYPYVTGAHTIANYVPAGLGIPNSSLGDVMGVAKAYTTRVGGGPFPTEILDETGAKIRSEGKGVRGHHGPPPRIGWLDLVALKYAVRLNGVSELALTKLDILTKVQEMKVCTRYSIDGGETSDFSKALPRLSSVKPVYEDMPSFFGAGLRDGQLPRVAEDFVGYLEDELKVKVTLVSTGEDRSATNPPGRLAKFLNVRRASRPDGFRTGHRSEGQASGRPVAEEDGGPQVHHRLRDVP